MSLTSPSLPQLLSAWLPTQRWFPAKGRRVELGRVGGFTLPDAEGLASLEVHLVAVTDLEDAAAAAKILQLPVSVRAEPLPDSGSFLIGVTEHAELGQQWVYDAVHDAAFITSWVRLMAVLGEPAAGRRARSDDAAEVFSARSSEDFRQWWKAVDAPLQPRLISGEQSNSSVILDSPGPGVILKFFRVLTEGLNPDVEVGRALAAVGDTAAPKLMGSVDGEWQLAGVSHRGSLCVVHQFVPGAQDGWKLAVRSAVDDGDFAAPAEELGVVLAKLHADLCSGFGATALDQPAAEDFLQDLSRRVRAMWAQVSETVGVEHTEQLDVVLDRLCVPGAEGDPASGLALELQRIHGDLHLGQVLATEEPSASGPEEAGTPGLRRWYILDFEGEPLRPIEGRIIPDVPLRDVVGVLRSFDYAAATARLHHGQDPSSEGSAWLERSTEAFLRGYHRGGGEFWSTESPLFLALWLDKALYEVLYEQRNRPAWLPVPLNAVRRALAPHPVQQGPEKGGPTMVDQTVMAAVAEGRYHDPHSVLGPHFDDDGVLTIRTARHLATEVAVVTASGRTPMTHEYGGIWTAVVEPEEPGHAPDYRIAVKYADGFEAVVDDPYRFMPTVGQLDLHLISEGRHEELWTVLGAHPRRYPSVLGEVNGVSFAVWAPNAQAVRIKSDFNNWDGRVHSMRSLGSSGVWELFIPEAKPGSRYKFEILSRSGAWVEKADPMAFGTEIPPLTASRVVASGYEFQDDEWMAARAASDPHQGPMSVYEVHLGSWRLGLGYAELAKELVEYVQWMGFTHVELMPVAEHPFGGSWGYQVTSYYAPTSRFGHPDEFKHLVDALHQAGIGVILDWVPAHFPKDEWALARFDGEALYEHEDPRLGEHPDWGTLIFDFGRAEVRNFLIANALYWLEEFHVDALRVDAVASMLYLDYSREEGQWRPNRFGGRENLEAISFLQEVNATAYKRSRGVVTIAEESTAFPGVTAPTDGGGLGFGLKWNMGWMHDSLAYIEEDPVNRSWHHGTATFSMVYAFTENFLLPISHDEVVHGKGSMLRKMPGDRWQQLANLRAFLAWQWAHPGKQLIFMGTEFGQEAEWSEQHGLDWWLADMPAHRGAQLMVRELNALYRQTPALWEQDNSGAGFEWIDADDSEHNVLAFIRWDKAGNPLVCVVNFSGNPHHGYRLALPQSGTWTEALNTDALEFGGSGVGNGGEVIATDEEYYGRPASATLSLPPLGALYLVPATS
ncbi:1,4-alpha-glucan branching protein GlgB [Psychromicrobium xiongbiense]|uniref:1,4-alpha-glucan branching protein GlgB n=1 Tax=Psychromicrobium xiongbiense TaxID=3051184 RepID=UPI002556D693|nr:1,4-alpha-glucan branching protein GlgB [Psychromicrobium sp. YIM S02556]